MNVSAKKVEYRWLSRADVGGGVAILWIWGQENELARLDACVGPPAGKRHLSLSPENNLRYGILRHPEHGGEVDEVLLARLETGGRVVSGHCGAAVRRALEECLAALGFAPAGAPGAGRSFFADAEESEAGRRELEELFPRAVTEAQVKALLSAWEGEGSLAEAENWLRPRQVALLGPYNSGKSSLLNRLAGYGRAFVSDWAGATLDPVIETIDLRGLTVRVADLPGLPVAALRAEAAGRDEALWARAWERARGELAESDAVVVVLDGRRPPAAEECEALAETLAEWRGRTGHTIHAAQTPTPVMVVFTSPPSFALNDGRLSGLPPPIHLNDTGRMDDPAWNDFTRRLFDLLW